MKFSLRRWLSLDGMLTDDARTASTPEEAIKAAEQLSGMYAQTVISDEVKSQIKAMEKGERIKIKKSYIKYSLIIKRLK